MDASARRVDGTEAVGYAIVTDHDVVESVRLPLHLSAQVAEPFVLTRAYILVAGQSVTIYTDSRTVHDFCIIWRDRGFLTSQGILIQHHHIISNLLEATLPPCQVAVCKCQAHVSGKSVW